MPVAGGWGHGDGEGDGEEGLFEWLGGQVDLVRLEFPHLVDLMVTYPQEREVGSGYIHGNGNAGGGVTVPTSPSP